MNVNRTPDDNSFKSLFQKPIDAAGNEVNLENKKLAFSEDGNFILVDKDKPHWTEWFGFRSFFAMFPLLELPFTIDNKKIEEKYNDSRKERFNQSNSSNK